MKFITFTAAIRFEEKDTEVHQIDVTVNTEKIVSMLKGFNDVQCTIKMEDDSVFVVTSPPYQDILKQLESNEDQ